VIVTSMVRRKAVGFICMSMRFLRVIHTSSIIAVNILLEFRSQRFWICFRCALAMAWNDKGKKHVGEVEMTWSTYYEVPERF